MSDFRDEVLAGLAAYFRIWWESPTAGLLVSVCLCWYATDNLMKRLRRGSA